MRALLRRLPGFRLWVLLRMALAGGEHQEAALAQVLRPANLFQPFTTTARDRYPEELDAVAVELAKTGVDGPRMLSFGCAAGEELLTLHQRFPDAEIVGIDINPLAVRRARRRVRGTGITVLRGSDAEDQPPASYDVVLALAVFRHGGLNAGPPSCAPVIRFGDFEDTVAGLARTVRPGGVLVIRHANFRFTDTVAAADFEVVRTGFPSTSDKGEPTPVYDREDRLLPLSARDDGVYRRRT